MTQRFTSIVQATEISNKVIASFQQDSTCWPPRLKVSEPGLAVRMAEGLGRGAATGAAQIVKK